MYGTVARMHVIAGKEAEMHAYGHYWQTERAAQVPGAIGGYFFQLENEPGVWVMAYVFTDKASYVANAQSEGMDRDYQRLRALLTQDPLWEDGEAFAM